VDGDLTEVRVAHRLHRVVLRFTATTLPRPATDHYDVMFADSDIRTPRGRYYATYYRDSDSELVVVGRAGVGRPHRRAPALVGPGLAPGRMRLSARG
jgi:hypothetical protein